MAEPKEATVSIMNIKNQKRQKIKSDRSAEHSCGNRKKITNAIDDLSHKNELIVLGVPMENGDEAVAKVKEYIEGIKPDAKYTSTHTEDRTHQKKKLRRWLKGAKTLPEESEVMTDIMTNLENDTPISDELIEGFKNIDGKISKRNDKIKSLESLQNSHNKIVNSEAKGRLMDVLTVEKVFKITERTSLNIDAVEQRKMQVEFHEKHFPDYPIIYTAAHYDESKDHCHLMHSGKNSKTGKFDYPDAEAKVVKNYMKEQGIDFSGKNKTWYEYNEEELKQHGEQWQNMNYDMANKKLKELGLDKEWKFKKLEGKEKQEAHDKIKNDPMAKKAITNRNYNNARLNEIKANKSGQVIKNNQLKIDDQQQEIEKNDETITEQKSILGRFKDEYKKFIQAGRKFIDKALNNSPEKDLNETAQKTAKHAHSAIQAQPKIKTEVSNNINKITQKSGSDKVEKAFSGGGGSGGGSGGSKSGGKCSVCNALPPMQSGICAVCYSRSQSGKENSEAEPEQKSRPRLL